MSVICYGLNHRTAQVDLRERLAFAQGQLEEAVREISGRDAVTGAVVLSTCNRVEIYGALADGVGEEAALDSVKAFVLERFDLGKDAVENFYERVGKDAQRHLLRVVSGLDSMMLGETEIFGQVKKAYATAHSAGATSKALNKLFQQAFQIGKLVRSSTQITHGATSVGAAAVDLAGKIFGDLSDCRVMIIGAGEMSRRTAMSLRSRGAASIIVSNRSYDRAVELAEEMGGEALPFDDWESKIGEVDIMVSSTSAPHHIIHVDHVRKALRRRGRPLFMIDIAVPRDIDPGVGDVDGVYLYDIDTLEGIAAEGRHQREVQIGICDRIIDVELEKFIAAQQLAHAGGPPPDGREGSSSQPLPNY